MPSLPAYPQEMYPRRRSDGAHPPRLGLINTRNGPLPSGIINFTRMVPLLPGPNSRRTLRTRYPLPEVSSSTTARSSFGLGGNVPRSYFSKSRRISARRDSHSRAVRTTRPSRNRNGSGSPLMRGKASKSGGNSPVFCSHSRNEGTSGRICWSFARYSRRSSGVMAPARCEPAMPNSISSSAKVVFRVMARGSLFLDEEQPRHRGQNQPHRGNRLAIGLRRSKFGRLLPTGVRIPDSQGLLTSQHYFRVYGLRGRVSEEVNVMAVLDFVDISQSAFVFVTASQGSHGLLDVDIAEGKHLLQSEVYQPRICAGKEQRLPAGLVLFDVIPEHVKILPVLGAPHIRFQGFVG